MRRSCANASHSKRAFLLAAAGFGLNMMSAQTFDKIRGLVVVNSLMALPALSQGENDSGFACNVLLAGLAAARVFKPDAFDQSVGSGCHRPG
jgi:hypothetical protein